MTNTYYELFRDSVRGIKQQRNNQVIGHCPFHDDRKRSWSGNTETGLWTCYAGCGSGNAYQFAKRLGINLKSTLSTNAKPIKKTNIPIEESKCPQDYWDVAYKYHKYLIEHYSELPIPENWSKRLIMQLDIGWDDKQNCFTFPHYNSEGKIITIHWHRGKSVGDGRCKWYPLHFIPK